VDRDAHQLARTVKRVAVIGGGWAGIAAAVEAVRRGHAVTLYETAHQLGGRARSVETHGEVLDNGQHILIGAYRETLALMRRVGVDLDDTLLRLPLACVQPDGRGLRLPPGPALPAFARGVLAHEGWTRGEQIALLRAATGWLLQGFACPGDLTVAQLAAPLPAAVRDELIEPLCVAALNTAADQASAAVFLRVLKDALFSGRGASDLLLPRQPLHALLPGPAQRWLQREGAQLRLGERVQRLQRFGSQWRVDDDMPFDAVVLACTAREAARLAADAATAWAAQAAAFDYEPIVTVTLRCPGARWPMPMLALRAGPHAPAQFAFDFGWLGGRAGVFGFVVSGARTWVERGLDACADATLRQAHEAFPPGTWPAPIEVVATLAEKRATFACTPGLRRPPAQVAAGCLAAGDYVDGPYPATLEGAVRAGLAAAQAL
jgi:squalene-associated FAD-dependent desaturase